MFLCGRQRGRGGCFFLDELFFWTNCFFRRIVFLDELFFGRIVFLDESFFWTNCNKSCQLEFAEEWMGARRCPREKACSCTGDLPRHTRPRRDHYYRSLGPGPRRRRR